MTILFLCRNQDLNKERFGYARAFRRKGIHLVCAPADCPLDADIYSLLRLCPESPALIVQPETAFPLLPRGLTEVDIPTACFQIDTHAYTYRRLRWSMLFDYAILFHPGFEETFKQAGHPRPITLPHAVDAEVFQGPELERVYEVGWVGRIDAPIYKTRQRVLGLLSERFRMNEWWRPHSYEEMAEVYRRSKIVVNVGGDDYPEDANLRVFEAMAAGALLITQLPSELFLLGFEEREHFVGYRKEQELPDIIRYYLDHESERRRIAEAGREKVLREHTYDERVSQLVEILQRDEGNLFAPARSWPEDKVRLVYLDYFAGAGLLDLALREFVEIMKRNRRTALYGLRPLAGALRRRWRWR
ncbi:MAG: hypothetical protein SLRJCFUN_000255 [Candidatus Fervidibacter sp.]